jgi:hypothetical protein
MSSLVNFYYSALGEDREKRRKGEGEKNPFPFSLCLFVLLSTTYA